MATPYRGEGADEAGAPARRRRLIGGDGPLDRSLLNAVAVFRWAALAWTVVVVAADLSSGSFSHAWAALALVALVVAFTLWATVMTRVNPGVLLGTTAILTELALDAALLLLDPWVYGGDRAQSLGTVWPLAGILMAGIRWAGRGGFAAGAALGLVGLLGQLRFFPGQWSGDQRLGALGTIVLYALAGAVGGFTAVKLREAEQRISVARAREEVARTLHDGVLQTLAVIQRRSGDPELVALAREQEVDLRAFLVGPADPVGLGAALHHAAGQFEQRFGGRVEVVAVAPPPVPRSVADAVRGAVGEALANAGKHGQADHATIFVADQGDSDGMLFVSVKDDGSGFDPSLVVEGFGITSSIRGRVAEVGGRVEVDGRPGRGTEVRLWVPV